MASQKPAILVVGKNSFIAGHLLQCLAHDRVTAVSHDALDQQDLLDDVDIVINAARHPGSSQQDYDIDTLDPDIRLARQIGDREIQMIMLSSRKVYAPSDHPLGETSPTGPNDAYGIHKLKAEQSLFDLLGERLTILRLANIFGDEQVAGRRSFLAVLLNRLAEHNQIRYNISPFVERDFVPVEIVAQLLSRILREPPGGVLNVGSGLPLQIGKLALWIMEGFKGGELLIDCYEEKDQFVLDITRLKNRYGLPVTLEDLRQRCLDLGSALRHRHQLSHPGQHYC